MMTLAERKAKIEFDAAAMRKAGDEAANWAEACAAIPISTAIKVQIYLDDGRIFQYDVSDAAKGHEHIAAIVKGGYCHNSGSGYLEYYPIWRILKVKLVDDIPTNYPDTVRGT